MKTSKNILVSALLFAAASVPAFADATFTYTDSSGNTKTTTLSGESGENYDVIKDATLTSDGSFTFTNDGTTTNMTASVVGGEFKNQHELFGNVALSGFDKVTAGMIFNQTTRFTLSNVGTVYLGAKNYWWEGADLDAALKIESALPDDFTLFTASEGTTTFCIDTNVVYIKFASLELLNSTKSIRLFDSSLVLDDSAGMCTFSIYLSNSREFVDYASATLCLDAGSADYGKLLISVPEPSAFGLLAGLGALALVASRRNRKFSAD